MGEILNLRTIRKARARAEKEERAAENRLKHGRTKSERLELERNAERQRVMLDGHRLGPERTDE